MGKRFDNLLFPGGKSKCFTLSYDDGVIQDRRLVEIFNKYHVKGTFNIGYGVLGFKADPKMPVDISKIEKDEVVGLYAGHEVAGHGLYHSALNTIGTPLAVYEVSHDKMELEKLTNKPLKMFAYPFGTYNDDVKEILRLSGYLGARTVKSTHEFNIPEDFLEWHPTCHHNDEEVFELIKKFFERPPFMPSLFYLWGHSYEFDINKNWERIEEILKAINEHLDDIWFATNGEIIEYVNAYKRLEYSTDGSIIYNPSAIDVYICTTFNQVEILKAGSYTKVKETVM